MSLPTRERGLKFIMVLYDFCAGFVAPYTGAWIEIFYDAELMGHTFVAPYTGAWIEILVV